ncbi:hypothetical protein HDU88_001792 [Geranomyces variabilis]|nr:hypothetical protein HDU88_001792 [Geranomyces variabilis]
MPKIKECLELVLTTLEPFDVTTWFLRTAEQYGHINFLALTTHKKTALDVLGSYGKAGLNKEALREWNIYHKEKRDLCTDAAIETAIQAVKNVQTIRTAAYQAAEAGVETEQIMTEARSNSNRLKRSAAEIEMGRVVRPRTSQDRSRTPPPAAERTVQSEPVTPPNAGRANCGPYLSGAGDQPPQAASCRLSELQAAAQLAYEKREPRHDSVLPSGFTIEKTLLEVGQRDGEKETLAHSWIVDLAAPWVRELPEADQLHLTNLWEANRKYTSMLDDRTMRESFMSDEVLARCEAQLETLENQWKENPLDAQSLWLTLATIPDVRDDERADLRKWQKIFDLRTALKAVLKGWCKNGGTTITSEASAFASLWDDIFSKMTPAGLRTFAAEETMEASKHRKLLTYADRSNVRGLQSDKAWVTSTGEVIVWGEGKRADWTEKWRDAEEALAKAFKGSKDCAAFIREQRGARFETFPVTWLGCNWDLYSTILLPSGAAITGPVAQLTMPKGIDGFLRLTHLLRFVLGWNYVLEREAVELARTVTARKVPGQLLCAQTPIKVAPPANKGRKSVSEQGAAPV